MEISAIFIIVAAIAVILVGILVAYFRIKREDKKEKANEERLKKQQNKNPKGPIKTDTNLASKELELNNIKPALQKTFSFDVQLKSAEDICKSLQKVEDKKNYYAKIYPEYFVYTDFLTIEKIYKEKDFNTSGFEKLRNYLAEQNIAFDTEPTDEDVEKMHQTLLEKGPYLIDNKKIFELATMKLFGYGCKQDLKAGFIYLKAAADFGNKTAAKYVYPFTKAFGSDFDVDRLAEVFENLWLLKRGNKGAVEKFASEVLFDYDAQYFTAHPICFDFAISCAEKAAQNDPTIWYKLASMLMSYTEFKGTKEQQNVPKYLKNAIKFCPSDRKDAENDLESWDN